ncbi:17637_t:CDS:2, partial [Racocetra persica]
EQRAYRELITEPVKFTYNSKRVISHLVLPVVRDELSITLKINVLNHDPYSENQYAVFYKGVTTANRTPSLWLKSSNSTPCLRLSITGNNDTGINMDGYGFLLNR